MLRQVSFFLVLLFGPGRPLTAQQADSIEFIFFDVGQGDAVLVRSFEGRTALIDAGGNSAIFDWLREYHVDSLDLVIATHPHRDHIGGMPHVVGPTPVALYLDNGHDFNSEQWRLLEEILVTVGKKRVIAKAETLTLGSTQIRILPPPPHSDGNPNNESVGALVQFGAFTALLTGDSEREELGYFVSLGIPNVTLLKAAHHGALNGVNPGWMLATRPKVVVISVGNNSYGHPDPRALRYYRTSTSAIYRTDIHGTVRVIGYRDGTWRVEPAAVELGAGAGAK